MNRTATATLLFALVAGAPAAASVSVTPAPAVTPAVPELPIHVGGRALLQESAGGPAFVRQWPGSYFETAFTGSGAYLKVGPGNVILHILVDAEPVVSLTKPTPGFYLINGLPAGPHKLRAEIVTEGQAG